MFQHPNENWRISCNYESIFDDLPNIDASIEFIHELTPPESITTLDPGSHSIDKEKLAKFVEHYEDATLNFAEKSPDYLIIDNFLEHFGLDNETLQGAQKIGSILAKETLRPELNNRQDLMLWFTGLTNGEGGIP